MSHPHSGSEGFGCLWLCTVTQMLAFQYPSACEPTNKVIKKNIRGKKKKKTLMISFDGTSTSLKIQSAKWESYMHSVAESKTSLQTKAHTHS